MLIGTGKSHGKIIIMGEHAVVYGYPAIALPLLSIPVIVQIKQSSEKYISSRYYAGTLKDIPETLSGIKVLINQLDEKLNHNNLSYTITIDSSLPIERGLGSSAAISAAIVDAFFDFFKVKLKNSEQLSYINDSETVNHGKASGLDGVTVISDESILFSKDKPVERFSFSSSGFIIIADSGVKGKTKQTVAEVRDMYNKDEKTIAPILEKLGDYTLEAYEALKSNNLAELGKTFNSANLLLSQLDLGSTETDRLIEAANRGGSLGSKITGGGKGGCIICLASNLRSAQKIRNELQLANAYQTWIQPLSIYEEETDID
ncbi:mevalonate kinase [Companilactobacillus metriopterae]|uniref:mevalonate kinase n=1 Tax=Companilactobacillus metriopterae TaxID=1909267 RepID=UPI00100BE0D8|nr:mevalonate kinase [Companilactobacillus metriopterae]